MRPKVVLSADSVEKLAVCGADLASFGSSGLKPAGFFSTSGSLQRLTPFLRVCQDPWRRGGTQLLGHAPQVLRDRCEQELIPGTCDPTQTQPIHLQYSLEVSEQHLDFLAIPTGLPVSAALGHLTRRIPGLLMDAASDLAKRCVWTASLLHWTAGTVALTASIDDCGRLGDVRARALEGPPCSTQPLTSRTAILILPLVPSEITARDNLFPPVRSAPHRDVGIDLLLVDQPAEGGCVTVGSIADQVSGLDVKTPLDSIDHGARGVNLLDTVCAGGFDIDDDSGAYIH